METTTKTKSSASSRALSRTLLTGATGAATVTLAHEVIRQLLPKAPRMDKLGMVALSRILRSMGIAPPRGEKLRGFTLLGDLGVNALFYAPVVLRSTKQPWLAGTLLGAAAGAGAVYLTPALGLPKRHRGTTPIAKAITVGLYALGGLAAGLVASMTRPRVMEPTA